jgi:hypothetical protein
MKAGCSYDELDSKDPIPEDSALVHPLDVELYDKSDLSLLLEYWNVEVLENRTHHKNLPIMKSRDRRDYFPMDVKKLSHHSKTPTLLELFKAEPSGGDLAEVTRFSTLH